MVLNVTIYISSNVNSLCVGRFSRNVIIYSFVDSGLGVETDYHEIHDNKEKEVHFIKVSLDVRLIVRSFIDFFCE